MQANRFGGMRNEKFKSLLELFYFKKAYFKKFFERFVILGKSISEGHKSWFNLSSSTYTVRLAKGIKISVKQILLLV